MPMPHALAAICALCLLALPLIFRLSVAELILWARRTRIIQWSPRATARAIRWTRRALTALVILEGLVLIAYIGVLGFGLGLFPRAIPEERAEFIFHKQYNNSDASYIYPDFSSCVRVLSPAVVVPEGCEGQLSTAGCDRLLPQAREGQRMRALYRKSATDGISCIWVRTEEGVEGWLHYNLEE